MSTNGMADGCTLPSRLGLRYTCVVRGSPRLSADRPLSSVLMSCLAVVLLLISLSGCSGTSKIFNRFSEPDGYWLPLTVDLRLDPSVTDAALEYTDACGQRQALPIGVTSPMPVMTTRRSRPAGMAEV